MPARLLALPVRTNARYLLIFPALVAVYFSGAVVGDAFLALGDGLGQFYPWMAEVARRYGEFSIPLWNPYEFSGHPLMAAMQSKALYPPDVLLLLLLDPMPAYNASMMLHYCMAGVFTYLYMRQIGAEAYGALVAGVVYSLLGYLPAHLMHTSIVTAGAWLPLVMLALERLRVRPTVRGALIAALAVAMQFLAGHPQIFFFTCLVMLASVAFHLPRLPRGRRWGFAAYGASALALGLLMALPQVMATFELAGLGTRGGMTYEEFATFSFPAHMTVGLVFPFLFGGGYAGGAWGPRAGVSVMEGFVGILPLAAAIWAFSRSGKEDSHVRFWGVVVVVAFILSLGDGLRPLNRLLFHLPVYNKFRGASKHWFEISFGLAVLSGIGIQALLAGAASRARREIGVALAAFLAAGVLGFSLLSGQARGLLRGLDLADPSALASAFSLSYPGVYVPLAFVAAYACVLLVVRNRTALKCALFVLLLAEAFSYKTATPHTKAEVGQYQRPLFEFLARRGADRAAFVTLSIPDSLLAMNYGISAIDGYDPLAVGDYLRLLDMEVYGVSRDWPGLLRDNLLLSMLNTKYLVMDTGWAGVGEVRGRVADSGGGRHFVAPIGHGLPQSPDYAPVYREAFRDGDIVVYENLNVLPRAYAVERLRPVEGLDDLRMLLGAFQLDPRREAAVYPGEMALMKTTEFARGRVTVESYSPERVAIGAEFAGEGFVVLADQYYPGWRAFVGGAETRIVRVNGVLRGVAVPPGRHEVVFLYRPMKVLLALALSAVLLIAATGLIIFPGREKGAYQDGYK